jgi:hypothetical protein
LERGDPVIGWSIIAVVVVALAAVVRWSLKGGGVGGYSAADQRDVTRAQVNMCASQQQEERVRGRRRWLRLY